MSVLYRVLRLAVLLCFLFLARHPVFCKLRRSMMPGGRISRIAMATIARQALWRGISPCLNWNPDVTNCSGTLTVYEIIYSKACASNTWTSLYTNSPHSIVGCRSSDSHVIRCCHGFELFMPGLQDRNLSRRPNAAGLRPFQQQ